MIINLTPHPITVERNGVRITFQPSGLVARVQVYQNPAGEVDGIPVSRTAYGDVTGLPEPQPGVVYIVSSVVAQALAATRQDLVAPDTNNAIRDEQGRIVAVRGFQAFWW